MGAILSKTYTLLSASANRDVDGANCQLALGLLTMLLYADVSRNTGATLEYAKLEHATSRRKCLRALLLGVPSVWMSSIMRRDTSQTSMGASCYIGYLAFLITFIADQSSKWWQPYFLNNGSEYRRIVINERRAQGMHVLPRIGNRIVPPVHTTLTIPLSILTVWKTTVSLQDRLGDRKRPLNVSTKEKIVYGIATAIAILYPFSKYFESYAYPSPWEKERTREHTRKVNKNKPDTQSEPSYLIAAGGSLCYMGYLGHFLFKSTSSERQL